MKYLLITLSAACLTACQQGPIVKSEPFDWKKAVNRNAERSCRDKRAPSSTRSALIVKLRRARVNRR